MSESTSAGTGYQPPPTNYWVNQFSSASPVPSDFSPVAAGATLPDYVQSWVGGAGKDFTGGQLGTFSLNGQTNYGYLQPGSSGFTGTGDSASFMTRDPTFTPITIPLDASASAMPGYALPPALAGQTIGGVPGGGAAFNVSNDVASVTPSENTFAQGIIEQQKRDEQNMLPYLGLAFPLIAGGAVLGGELGLFGSDLAGFGNAAGGAVDTGAFDVGQAASELGVTTPDAGVLGGAGGAVDTGAFDVGNAAFGDLGITPASGSLPSDVSLFGATSDPIDAGAAAGGTWDIPAAGGGVVPTGAAAAPAGVADTGAWDLAGGVAGGGGGSAAGGGSGLLGRVSSALGIDDASKFLGISPSTLVRAGISGAGLISDLSRGNKVAGNSQLNDIAANALNQSGILQSYLTSGTLPPAVQAAVNQATQDGITKIKSNYAARGIAPGSTMETQDIARLQQNAVVQGATLAEQLYSQGLSEAQIAAGVYQNLQSTDMALNQQTGQAIANLAAALAGGGSTLKLVQA